MVRELYGIVAAESASGGIVISSGTFTQEAKDFAIGKPIDLLDGSLLLNLIAEVQETPAITIENGFENSKKRRQSWRKILGLFRFPKMQGNETIHCITRPLQSALVPRAGGQRCSFL